VRLRPLPVGTGLRSDQAGGPRRGDRLAARLEEGDGAAESLLAQLRERAQRRRVQEEARERLLAEARDEDSRRARIEATIAAVEEASAAGALDYEGKRQALSDLGVWIDVYPSWRESNYRWVMVEFEERAVEAGRRWRSDGDTLRELPASGAASPSHPPPRTQAAHTTRARRSCAAIRPGAPLPLRWTDCAREPRAA
jgi:hypothetical protein